MFTILLISVIVAKSILDRSITTRMFKISLSGVVSADILRIK